MSLNPPQKVLTCHIRPENGRLCTAVFGAALTCTSQGLILVHFSAQPEPSLSLTLYETTTRIPQKSVYAELKKWTGVSP